MNIPSSPDLVVEFRSHLKQTIKDMERDLPLVQDPSLLATLKDLYNAHITILAELDEPWT